MTEINAGSLFSYLPASFSLENAEGVEALIQLRISGENGGDWYLDIRDKQCNLVQGLASNPHLTLESSSVDFKDLVEGRLDPTRAFMSGKLRFSGNMRVAMKLVSLFGKKG